MANEINQRIYDAFIKSKMSVSEFAKACGLSRTAVYNLFKTTTPSAETIAKIAAVLNVSTSYLLGRDNAPTMPSNVYPVTPYIRLPKLGIIRAGQPICTEQGDYGEWEFADERYGNGEYFMLDVHGDSMSPTIPDGSVVIIHQQNYANPGDIVAFALEGEYATLKRYFPQSNGTILLRGDNAAAESYTATKDQMERGEAYIIGVATECKFRLQRR